MYMMEISIRRPSGISIHPSRAAPRALVGRRRLRLEDSQLTFFIAHSEIDSEHAREVREVLCRHCKSASDWAAVQRVLVTSLRLTGRFLDDVHDEYERLLAGAPTGYGLLARHL
jgi:hypothetical protein